MTHHIFYIQPNDFKGKKFCVFPVSNAEEKQTIEDYINEHYINIVQIKKYNKTYDVIKINAKLPYISVDDRIENLIKDIDENTIENFDQKLELVKMQNIFLAKREKSLKPLPTQEVIDPKELDDI